MKQTKKKVGRPSKAEKIAYLTRLAFEPQEICDVLNIDITELEKYRQTIEENFLGEKEHRLVRIKRFSRGSGFYGYLRAKLKTSLRLQIADMIIREMGDVEDLIGYNVEDLILDFENKFEEGMDWTNWGEWQIDHIKPRVLFTTKELKECFSLLNLQPLLKHQNLSKGSKYSGAS